MKCSNQMHYEVFKTSKKTYSSLHQILMNMIYISLLCYGDISNKMTLNQKINVWLGKVSKIKQTYILWNFYNGHFLFASNYKII